jgi:hypothetical protein
MPTNCHAAEKPPAWKQAHTSLASLSAHPLSSAATHIHPPRHIHTLHRPMSSTDMAATAPADAAAAAAGYTVQSKHPDLILFELGSSGGSADDGDEEKEAMLKWKQLSKEEKDRLRSLWFVYGRAEYEKNTGKAIPMASVSLYPTEAQFEAVNKQLRDINDRVTANLKVKGAAFPRPAGVDSSVLDTQLHTAQSLHWGMLARVHHIYQESLKKQQQQQKQPQHPHENGEAAAAATSSCIAIQAARSEADSILAEISPAATADAASPSTLTKRKSPESAANRSDEDEKESQSAFKKAKQSAN